MLAFTDSFALELTKLAFIALASFQLKSQLAFTSVNKVVNAVRIQNFEVVKMDFEVQIFITQLVFLQTDLTIHCSLRMDLLVLKQPLHLEDVMESM